jgi:hypothetical protein
MIVVGILAIVAAAIFLFQDELRSPPLATPVPYETPASADRVPRRRPLIEPKPAEPSPVPAPISPEPEVAVQTPVRVLPALADSDPFLREELGPLGLPQDWIAENDLVRRLAVFADNATRGELARRPLAFLKPTGRFDVVERDGRLYGDPRNAIRFDPLLDALEAIDPEAAGRFFETTQPLLETAFQELGSALSPDQVLGEVIARIAETPRDALGQELIQSKVLYEYKDSNYESLPPFEKQLLRLGARNLDRLERYLRALRSDVHPAR